ncbi:MAG: Uncharacterized protein JWN70_200 [Planctomycetaceae bacterium]|nr:Uncharacterized protein [Planctomycetaceae bacterium]
MHKLNRAAVQRPACLDNYDWNTQTWDKLHGQNKKRVRLSLQSMQGQQIVDDASDDEQYFIVGLRCAYCEGQIYYGGHIEHFRRKNPAHYPALTFEWTNLFIACGSKEHCGHYKDRPSAPPYAPDNLIKPDEHVPDDYLYFHTSGEVRVRHRPGMTDNDRRRGAETIRVFNLNCGRLRGDRQKAVNLYLSRSKRILEDLMEFEENDRQAFIDEEIEATKWEPFWTTIRHSFEKLHA